MNTPAHLILGAALFSKRDNTRLLTGALLGGLLPDISLYVMAGVSLFILGISPDVVFNDLYFSDNWQLVFSVDNSFLIWTAVFAAAFYFKSPFFIALASAALLHLVCDFGLHNDDARIHFWPLSNWRFESPFSYWDSNHHAGIVAPLEGAAVAIALLYLITGKLRLVIKLGLTTLFLAELFVLRSWLLHF